MTTNEKQWEIALDTLVKVAHNAGVSESETNLWKVQHIDSSLSRLVRVTSHSVTVIADGLYSPGALLTLVRLYPPSDRVIYQQRDFSLIRDESGFRVSIRETSCSLGDSDVLDLISNLMSEFKTRDPRVM